MRAQPPHRGLDAGERLRQPGQQQPPGGGQLDLAVEPVKQADPEIGFERVDLMADRGRGDVQFLGGLLKLFSRAAASKARKRARAAADDPALACISDEIFSIGTEKLSFAG